MISMNLTNDPEKGITLWLVAEAEERAARWVDSKVVLDLGTEGQLLACQLMNAWANETLHLRRASSLLDPEPPPENPDALSGVGATLRILPRGDSLTVNLRSHRPSEAAEHFKVAEAELILDHEDRLIGLAIPPLDDFNPARAILGLGHEMV